jgi:hypothetical protein
LDEQASVRQKGDLAVIYRPRRLLALVEGEAFGATVLYVEKPDVGLSGGIHDYSGSGLVVMRESHPVNQDRAGRADGADLVSVNGEPSELAGRQNLARLINK